MAVPKSRTKGELIPAVIVEFHDLPDYYWTKDQWDANGKYKGFLQSHCLPIAEIKKVHHLLLNPKDFPSTEWEG